MAEASEAAEALAQYVRSEAGQLVASLTRELRNFDLAEEAVQDAILAAVRHWPVSGAPQEPGAWLRVTARRKAIGRLRREARYRDRLELLDTVEEAAPEPTPGVIDDRLVLIFMCCHPTLSREAQVALTLRSLLGLTTTQLAKAFLTTEATMTQRIVRAKRTIVEAGIPFALPSGDDVTFRLGEALTSVYAMFNEGYLSAGPSASQRPDLASDAEWLAGLLLQLLPEEPEVIGLLALIRLHQARRSARFDAAGALVLLQDQDRSRWDRAAIDDALALLNRALRLGAPGAYQAQAAIAACHATARRWEETNWGLIVRLYDQLLTLTDSPIAALNRAIALQYRDGPEAALAELEPMAGRLTSYHLFHAAKAQLLRALDRTAEAAAEDRLAWRLTSNPAELRLLQRKIDDALGMDLEGQGANHRQPLMAP
jgi:RNA polymerase sigma-70 factor (ECF subfamily)